MKVKLSWLVSVYIFILIFGGSCVVTKKPQVTDSGEESIDGFSSLQTLTKRAAQDLYKKIGSKKLCLDISNILDTKTGETSTLSIYLMNEMEAAFSNQNFLMVDDQNDANFVIKSGYQRVGRNVKIFIKNIDAKSVSRSNGYTIHESRLPKDSFIGNIDTKAFKLANKIIGNQRGLTIYVNPLVKSGDKHGCDFSEYLTLKLKSNITQWGGNILISEKPKMKILGNKRGMELKAKKVKNLSTNDAYYCGANAVLDGTYFVNSDNIKVILSLKDLNGNNISSAEEKISKYIVEGMSLENKKAQKIAEVADVTSEKSSGMVKISTTKGCQYQTYYTGEKIKFNIQVKKPLYVYIYNINSKKEVTRLYPYKNEVSTVFREKIVYTLPSEKDRWEIEVAPPYGLDIVKIFVSSNPLPLPDFSSIIAAKSFTQQYGVRGMKRVIGMERKKAQKQLSVQKKINHLDLVDYYRGISKKNKTVLYEDSVFVKTSPKP